MINEEEENMNHLSTGSKEVDALLGGGLPTGLITEIHALNGIGKTQFCITA